MPRYDSIYIETYQDDVAEFYRVKRGSTPILEEASDYFIEECSEAYRELTARGEWSDEVLSIYEVDREKLAKELADVLFTAYGVAIAAGIDLDVAFEIVARDNMENKVKTEDGKVQKREGYTPPNMEPALL